MSVREGLLALLAARPKHGYQLKSEFESATAGLWPLNIGQVYSTLERLERDGLVSGGDVGTDGRKPYELTGDGRIELEDWFSSANDGPPSRDGLMLKVLVAVNTASVDPITVIDTQRAALLRSLQEHRRGQRKALGDVANVTNQPGGPKDSSTHGSTTVSGRSAAPDRTPDEVSALTATLLFDALIAKTEGELRWLELCEERLRTQLQPTTFHSTTGTTQ